MRIPVTLLSGYLGAGKTTVINHLLGLAAGPRFTVLVNDFGSLDIDARLIASNGGNTIELSNGCACCSIGEDVSEALASQIGLAKKPERIVIEASGVADPRRIAKIVGAWPDLLLDAIVTVADAGTIRARAADKFVGSLVRRQLHCADILLLNKTDLLREEDRAALSAWLGPFAATALRIDVVQGAVDPSVLFGPDVAARPDRPDAGIAQPALPCFHTRTFDVTATVDLAALGRILMQAPPGVHRVKGFVSDCAGRVHLVQHVGDHQPSIEPFVSDRVPIPRGLVAIATNRAALDTFAADFLALQSKPTSTAAGSAA